MTWQSPTMTHKHDYSIFVCVHHSTVEVISEKMRQLSLNNVPAEKLVLFLTFIVVLFGSVIMCSKYRSNIGMGPN